MTDEGAYPLPRRWWVFIKERFPLPSHLAMVTAFLLGNIAATGIRPAGRTLLFLAPAILLFFLRLRIFDEIKDCDGDRTIHPERPLARGLISVREAKTMAAVTAGGEAILLIFVGGQALAVWAFALIFSLFMYREFFIGAWLRPRMELYAITHTLVASWIACIIAAAVMTSVSLPQLITNFWPFALANWMVFNVFEFARKTFAPEEERDGVDSYSRRLRPRGAVTLSLVMVAAALALAAPVFQSSPQRHWAWLVLALFGFASLAGAVPYLLWVTSSRARLFRGTMSGFIVGFHLMIFLLRSL